MAVITTPGRRRADARAPVQAAGKGPRGQRSSARTSSGIQTATSWARTRTSRSTKAGQLDEALGPRAGRNPGLSSRGACCARRRGPSLARQRVRQGRPVGQGRPSGLGAEAGVASGPASAGFEGREASSVVASERLGLEPVPLGDPRRRGGGGLWARRAQTGPAPARGSGCRPSRGRSPSSLGPGNVTGRGLLSG